MHAGFYLRPEPTLAERSAGACASALAWLAVLAALALGRAQPFVPAVPIDFPPIEIVVEIPEPEPEPVAVAPGETWEEAVATHAATGALDGTDTALTVSAPPGPGNTIESWRPSAQQAGALAELRLKLADEAAALAAQKQELARGITDRELNLAGREFILNSDGGTQGVIRTLDVSGHDEDEVMRVLRTRYGITVETRHVTPQAGRNFLNAARTAEGTFTTAAEAGVYDVFILSAKARSMMASMEVKAMQGEGYDPTATRVREIEFGMVRDERTGELSLAVVKLRAERIR